MVPGDSSLGRSSDPEGAADPYLVGVVPARRTIGGRLRDAYWAGPLHRWRIGGRPPDSLLLQPRDPWPGDKQRGAALLDPAISFGHGRTPPNSASDGGPHAFGWLRDLHAVGSDAARARARVLILDWIETYGDGQALAWRPDILGRRLSAWIAQYDFFADGTHGDDADFAKPFLSSLGRQARHLVHAARRAPPGPPRFAAAKGLVFVALAVPGMRRHLGAALALIEAEIPRQILPDGGHRTRAPAFQLMVLRDLVAIRSALLGAGGESATALTAAIGLMAPMLRFFRHGDGGLALFNGGGGGGGGEGDPFAIDLVLSDADAPGRPPAEAPESGFERLAAGETVVIADIGASPAPGFDAGAHAGALSFEMSVGAERVIVNCGAAPPFAAGADAAWADLAWADGLRATAAHSTLVVDDTNSAEVVPGGGLGRRPGQAACTRSEADAAVWLDMQHDGYAYRFGLSHHRRLYLSADGDDFRGEDRLLGLAEGRPFAVRFHLHPEVRILDDRPEAEAASDAPSGGEPAAESAGGGDSGSDAACDLHLPGGGVWRFRVTGATLSVEPSVYLGRGAPIETQQIVLTGFTTGPTTGPTTGDNPARDPDKAGPDKAGPDTAGHGREPGVTAISWALQRVA